MSLLFAKRAHQIIIRKNAVIVRFYEIRSMSQQQQQSLPSWKERFFTKSKQQLGNASSKINDTCRKTSETVSTLGIMTRVKQTWQHAAQKIITTTTTTTAKNNNRITMASNAILQKAAGALSYVTKAIGEAASSALRQQTAMTTNAIKQQLGTVGNHIRSRRDQALRWFFCWSLAAVGIYGLATTLPRELIHHYYEMRKHTKESNDNTNEPSTPFQKVRKSVITWFPWKNE